jgi:hypothetical protein
VFQSKKHAHDVDVEDAPEFGEWILRDRMDRSLDPGVVEEDVDFASGVERTGDEARDRALVGDVALNRNEFRGALEFVAEAQ